MASRRKCEEYIRDGWIAVNGEVIRAPETRIDPTDAHVLVRGKAVKPPAGFRYILINKPVGVLCTCQPGRERGRSIMDLVKVPERIFPAGRLDKDTSGLLLLTNDGTLVQKLIHPSFQKEREYIIETERPLLEADLKKLRAGVMLEDGFSQFQQVERAGKRSLKVILIEGRKRQIRRTLETLDLPIRRLHRIRFGSLRLSNLSEGQWRDLKASEIRQLIS